MNPDSHYLAFSSLYALVTYLESINIGPLNPKNLIICNYNLENITIVDT